MIAAFSSIRGQQWALSYLTGAIEKNRLPQTMIFLGVPYVGKESTALSLASHLLCEQSTGCGSCNACLQVRSYQHPDLHYFFPCPASWYREGSGFGDVIASRSNPRNRLGEPLADPNLLISIEAVRMMTGMAARRSFGGQAKVFIIRNAERMRDEAQNALLKLLEEAPRDTYFVLCTTNSRTILSTVLSRAHIVRFSPLREDDWISILLDMISCDAATAKRLYRLSGGNLARAEMLLDEEQSEERLLAFDFIASVWNSYPGQWARELARRYGETRDRDAFDRCLDYLLIGLRDAIVTSSRGSCEASVLNNDMDAVLDDVARHLTMKQLVDVIWKFEQLRQSMRLNLDIRLGCYRAEHLLRTAQDTIG